MHNFGRRTIYMWGFVVMGVWQLMVGVLGFVKSVNATLAIGAIMVVINFTFNVSLGPLCSLQLLRVWLMLTDQAILSPLRYHPRDYELKP